MHTDGPGADGPSLNDKWNVSPPGISESETPTPRYSKCPSDKFKFSPPLLILVNPLVYYRIYAEDGAILSKTPVVPGNPFLGRIKARSVPPPHTVQGVKRSIVKVEDIKDGTITSLFRTPHSQSPMGDADEVAILNRTGPGSTPQGPLALVAKMSDSERSALESGGRGELASAVEPDTMHLDIRYCTSIQHSPTFFHNISTVGGSVLSTLL